MKFIDKFNMFLNSRFYLPFFTIIMFIGYYFNFTELNIAVLGLLTVWSFLFRDDLDAILIFPLFFYFIVSRKISLSTINLITATLLVVSIILSFIYFIVKQIQSKRKWHWGGASLAFFLYFIATFFAGITYPKNNYQLAPLYYAELVALMIFYLLAINFVTDQFKEKFVSALLYAAFLASIEVLHYYLTCSNLEVALSSKTIRFAIGRINTPSVILAIATPFCFYRMINKKHPWGYFVLLFVYCLALFFTYSRGNILSVAWVLPGVWLYALLKTNKKSNFTLGSILGIFFVVSFVILLFIYPQLLGSFGSLGFSSNGRMNIYRIGWNLFKKYPFFGIGYFAQTPVFSFWNFYWFHNTFLQILACGGIIGFIPYLYFYFKRYQPYFKNRTLFSNFSIFALFIFELYGLIDVSAINFILMMVCLMLLALRENELRR